MVSFYAVTSVSLLKAWTSLLVCQLQKEVEQHIPYIPLLWCIHLKRRLPRTARFGRNREEFIFAGHFNHWLTGHESLMYRSILALPVLSALLVRRWRPEQRLDVISLKVVEPEQLQSNWRGSIQLVIGFPLQLFWQWGLPRHPWAKSILSWCSLSSPCLTDKNFARGSLNRESQRQVFTGSK